MLVELTKHLVQSTIETIIGGIEWNTGEWFLEEKVSTYTEINASLGHPLSR